MAAYLMLDSMQMPTSPISSTSYENLCGRLSSSNAVHAPGDRSIPISVLASNADDVATNPSTMKSEAPMLPTCMAAQPSLLALAL